MKLLRFFAALALVTLLHFAGTRLLPDFPRAIDLFLVATVLTAAGGGSLAGMLGGMVAGLTCDALSGRLYGLYGFTDTIIGYGTARMAQRLIFDRAGVILVTLVIATFVQHGILTALEFGLLERFEPPDPLWWTVEALANGLTGGICFALSGTANRAQARRQERVEKLRLKK
ncbi:MAG TPA: rod shape-determining protein MreD [Thermoanaerobaculia bacterium]|nr:rod shape-determining protein MreD [Thermoanaerobaculia bacterium]